MSEPFDLTLIEDFANCGLSGHKGTVAGVGLRRNRDVRLFYSGGRSDSSDDSSEDLNESDSDDSYNVLDHISLPAMVSHQNSGWLSEEDRKRAFCKRHGQNFMEEHHKRYIHEKVKELNKNNEWWGEKEWNEGICSNFEEGDRITGWIRNEENKWYKNICSNFKEFKKGDRITKGKAYNIALESGMHPKDIQHTIDNLTASIQTTFPCATGVGTSVQNFLHVQVVDILGRSVRYCNRECQCADWGKHQKLCSHK